MRKLIYILIVFCIFLFAGIDFVKAIPQDTIRDLTEEELAIQDSVSIDDLDPVFYNPLEEEEEEMEPEKSGNAPWIIYIVIGVVVIVGGFFFFRKSKGK
jgi:hypothetical protein